MKKHPPFLLCLSSQVGFIPFFITNNIQFLINLSGSVLFIAITSSTVFNSTILI